MSKTIEVASVHKGPINLCTRKDEQRTIMFEDKGDVGYAMVDEDEAEILLSIPGDFWKPGASTASTESIVESAVAALDGDAAESAQEIRGRKSRTKKTDEPEQESEVTKDAASDSPEA